MESLTASSERLPYPLRLHPSPRRGAGLLRPPTGANPSGLHPSPRRGAGSLRPPTGGVPGRSPFAVPEDFDAFQSEYIRLFEVGGRGGAPCPLHSGHYTNDRLRALEVLVRFYNFFGVQAEEGMMPDHVTAELEFMAYLIDSTGEAVTDRERRSLEKAQADFLGLHLLSWWPQLSDKLGRQHPLPFYRSLANLTSRFLEADHNYLTATLQA